MNTGKIKEVLNNKNWNWNAVQVHVETPLITLIKSKNDEILDIGYVEIKLHRDPTSRKLVLYELKTALFDNGKPEEFLLFIRNFNVTLRFWLE